MLPELAMQPGVNQFLVSFDQLVYVHSCPFLARNERFDREILWDVWSAERAGGGSPFYALICFQKSCAVRMLSCAWEFLVSEGLFNQVGFEAHEDSETVG